MSKVRASPSSNRLGATHLQPAAAAKVNVRVEAVADHEGAWRINVVRCCQRLKHAERGLAG